MRFLAVVVLVLLADRCGAQTVSTDAPFRLDAGAANLVHLDALPFVNDEYTRRFRFDSHSNPKLKELRARYRLDEVIAPGTDEFHRQVLLMDWVHHRFRKFGAPSTNVKGALKILGAIEQGHTFFCSHYVHVLVSCAASVGWIARPLALRRHQGAAKVGGSTEHAVTEIWSNQHRKWVMLDPTSNMCLERGGVPLNAWEIREEWFYRDGTNSSFIIGRERKRYKKTDLPIFLRSFAGFGDLAVNPDELDKYGFIGYIPNNDLMDAGEDYARMFIVKDKLCDGTKWHVRQIPANPATDPYFPINQAALDFRVQSGKLSVVLRTLTPNFNRYEVQIDDGEWKPSTDEFVWPIHSGANKLAARTVNQFGITGPVSTAVLEVTASAQ